MTVKEWLDTNREVIAKRLTELKLENPGAVIIPPGMTKAIDGKEYFNDMFIIAK